VKTALAGLGLEPHQVMLVSGIGQSSKLPDYTHANGFMTLHGRAIPCATGIKLVRPDLKVIVNSGDGDGYGEGLGHMMHAARRNIGIVHVAHNNQIYGLTKGQYSPTSDPGTRTKTSPEGAIDRPVNPLLLALAAGATFVARGFSKSGKELSELIMAAIQHRGYALIDVLQPCVTFNRVNTYEWYAERVYKVENEPGYDPRDLNWAMRDARNWGDRIPTGILYQVEDVPSYEEQVPGLKDGPVGLRPVVPLAPEKVKELKAAYL
jgi:2-oxoglutarate ferredoxin oxidoreductase subunit beta